MELELQKNKNINADINIGKKFFNTIHFICGIFLLAWLNNGLFSYISPFLPGVFRWAIFLYWFIFAIMKSRLYLVNLLKHSFPLLILISYILALSFFNNEFYLNTYISSFSYLFVIYSVFLFYYQGKYMPFLKLLILYFITEYVFLAINTFIKLQQNPLIARILTADVSTIQSNLGVSRLAGVGNYAYFYSLVAVIIFLVYLLLYYPKHKTMNLLLICLFLVVLIKASFTLALLLTGLFILIITLKKFTKYTIITIPILLFFTYVSLINGTLAAFFIKISTVGGFSNEISVRLLEVADFLSGNSVDGSDLGSRLSLYTQSLEAFYNHMFTGTSLFPYSTFVAGDHSAWLDLLARFGFISILLFLFLFNVYKYTSKNIALKYKRILIICWIYFIVLGIFNTLFFASIFTVWIFFLPVAIKLIDKKERAI